MLHVSPEKFDAPGARELIALANREWSDRFVGTPQSAPQLDEATCGRDGVLFLMAWFGGDPAGIGILVPLARDAGEVRGLFVDPTVRGRGIGAELLREMEKRSAQVGRTQLVAFAGDREPEARALFEKFDYDRDPLAPPEGRTVWRKSLTPVARVA